ncbi:MEDS domain-containing protein [Dactylosporangium sp. NBC_01737]|uniref:MEDS domain-containing protein n=1 Tax=Dactylosporangium sp. NBC_01737 TaxID=2975959 RepID=UPI002E0F7316|nr:MEDS domain-containing protein [Dactylosporangium sp. NBC_01737]
MRNINDSVSTKHTGHVRLGDHLCLPFASDLEQREVVSAYIADGLIRGERVLYYSDKTAPRAIDAWLDPRGIDGALAMARGQLEVRSADDHFDPGAMVDGIRHAVRDARTAGFQGLRLTGEMSWALPDTVRLHEYESGVASTVTGSDDLAAICQYDERLFDKADITGLVARHPGVVHVDPLHDDRRLRIVPTFSPRGLRICGTVDDLTAGAFADALAHTTQWPERIIVVDVAELLFIDVAGIRALVRAAEALAPDRTLHVRHLAPTLRNVLRIVGWDTTPGLTIGDAGVPAP